MNVILSRALIPPALMLVTGFRAPALAETYRLPAVDVFGEGTTWYAGDDVNDLYHYTGATVGLDWGRFNGVRWHQPAAGAGLNVTDDAGAPIPYTVTVALSDDHRFLLVTIEPTGGRVVAGDFNGDGDKTPQDLFDFLEEYFAREERGAQELFDFLAAWSG